MKIWSECTYSTSHPLHLVSSWAEMDSFKLLFVSSWYKVDRVCSGERAKPWMHSASSACQEDVTGSTDFVGVGFESWTISLLPLAGDVGSTISVGFPEHWGWGLTSGALGGGPGKMTTRQTQKDRTQRDTETETVIGLSLTYRQEESVSINYKDKEDKWSVWWEKGTFHACTHTQNMKPREPFSTSRLGWLKCVSVRSLMHQELVGDNEGGCLSGTWSLRNSLYFSSFILLRT